MAPKTRSRRTAEPAMTLPRAQRLTGIGLDNADLSQLASVVSQAPWMTAIRGVDGLLAGQRTEEPLVIPQSEAQAALRGVVRLVADLPRGSTPTVVWQAGGSELEVNTAATTLSCKVGVVTIGVAVACDQLERTVVEVPFGVGTATRPAGLVMSTIAPLPGPALVVDRWSDAITAFAWECLVETARRLCELVGTDAGGRHLVPGAVGSGSKVLLVQPMSPHTSRVRP